MGKHINNKQSVTTAAGREHIIELLQSICKPFSGCKVTIEPMTRREIYVHINYKGINCSIELDGNASQPDVFILPFNTIMSKLLITENFGRAVGAKVNNAHHRKCMAIATGYTDLILIIQKALDCLSSGDAVTASEEINKIKAA